MGRRKGREGGMEGFIEDITDGMAGADGGLPARTLAAERPALAGDAPSARGGHTATCINGCLYVYGGADRQQRYCDRVFRLRIATRTWETVTVDGAGPRPRSGHSAVAWRGEGVLVFGGINMALETFFHDAWLLTVPPEGAPPEAPCVWSEVTVQGAAPLARNSHSACIVQAGALAGRMIVIGGSAEDGPLSSIQVADLSGLPDSISWTHSSDASHSQMAPREMHAAVALGEHVIVFGGRVNAQEAGEQVSDELITINAKDERLRVISVDKTDVRRCGHSMCAISDERLLVSGGIDLSVPHVCTEHMLIQWATELVGRHDPGASSAAAADRGSAAVAGAAAESFEGSVSQLKKALLQGGVAQSEIAQCSERRDLEELWRSLQASAAATSGSAGVGGDDAEAVYALDVSWQAVVMDADAPEFGRFAHSSCVLPSPGPESGGLEAVQVLVLGGVDFEQDYSEPLLLDVGPLCSDLA